MNADEQTKLDLIVDSYASLYKHEFRDYHKRAIKLIGKERWLEQAEKAIREGIDPARYFSHLIKQDMKQYNAIKKSI